MTLTLMVLTEYTDDGTDSTYRLYRTKAAATKAAMRYEGSDGPQAQLITIKVRE